MSDWFQKCLNFNIKTLLCPRLLQELYSTANSFVAGTHENAINSLHSLMPRSYILSLIWQRFHYVNAVVSCIAGHLQSNCIKLS